MMKTFIKKYITNSLAEYITNANGSIAPTFVVSLMVLLTGVGAAIDYALAAKTHNLLQDTVDAAALATIYERTATAGSTDLNAFAKSVITTQLNTNNIDATHIQVSVTEYANEPDKLTVDVNYDQPNIFFAMFGKKSTQVGVDSTVVLGATGHKSIEITLVLDVSLSMRGGKITSLKRHTKDFIEEIYSELGDDVYMNIVPFGGTVSIDSDLNHLIEPGASSTEPACLDVTDDTFDDELMPSGHYSLIAPNRYKHARTFIVCPQNSSKIMLYSNNKAELIDKIDRMEMSWGTATHHGMYWALKTMSPKWRGIITDIPDRPMDYGKHRKYIVLMSDGAISADQYKRLYSQKTAITQLYEGCNFAKQNDIVIFSIGYQSRQGYIKNCASSPGHYSYASTRNLDKIYNQILGVIGETQGSRITH